MSDALLPQPGGFEGSGVIELRQWVGAPPKALWRGNRRC
jgi:hypothetical protein